jgi:myo-inositol-1(or 4)-monophosphatase
VPLRSTRPIPTINILKEACTLVHSSIGGLAGTPRGMKGVTRGAGGDISTHLDLMAEKLVLELLEKRGVEATVIAEESGEAAHKENKRFVIVDAIDGTTNAHRKIPFYCCSVAFADGYKLSSVTDAAIMDLTTGDQYWASRGRGAFVGNTRIHASGSNFGGIIGMNISAVDPKILEQFAELIARAKHIRQFGAIALELCFVARGLLDAYVDFRGKVRPTDLAAGYLIAKEAGAVILSTDGNQLDSSLNIANRISFFAGSPSARKEFAGLFKN